MQIILRLLAFDVVIQILSDVGADAGAVDAAVRRHLFGDAGKRFARDFHVGGVNPPAIHRPGDAVGEHRGARGFLPEFRLVQNLTPHALVFPEAIVCFGLVLDLHGQAGKSEIRSFA